MKIKLHWPSSASHGARPADLFFEYLLICAFLFLSLSVVVVFFGTLIPLRFSTVAVLLGCLLLIVTLAGAKLTLTTVVVKLSRNDLLVIASVLICGLLVGAMAASIIRPDIDDSVYGPKAVFYTEHPSAQLDFGITWLAGITHPVDLLNFQYYETIEASMAWLLGVHFLVMYHIAFPFVVGLLAFCAMYLLVGVFNEPAVENLLASILIVLLLLVLGELHRSVGNVTIARAFQGKFVLFFLGFYVWSFFSLRYFKTKNTFYWLVLLISAIALCGMSTTALVYLPLLSAILFLSFHLSEKVLFRVATVRFGVQYVLTIVPVIISALVFRETAKKYLVAGNVINVGFASDFWGQFSYVNDMGHPMTLALVGLSVIAVLLFSAHKKFLLAWMVLPIIFLLNPWMAGFVIKHITTENIYWRLFYLLPVPLISGLAVLASCKTNGIRRAVLLIAIVLTLPLIAWGPTSVLRSANNATFEPFHFKIHEPVRTFVLNFVKTHDAGSVLAPLEIASNLVICSSRYPQIYLREDFLYLTLIRDPGENDLTVRSKAASFLYGDLSDESSKSAFQALLAAHLPNYVILREQMIRKDDAVQILHSHGYQEHEGVQQGYEVWVNETIGKMAAETPQ